MGEFLTGKSCTEFVAALASNAPAPGGGGAAALVAAVGTALGNMVGSLTIGKKKYAHAEDEILTLKAKSDKLQEELLNMVEKDAEAFTPLARAYSLPAGTDKQRIKRAAIMEQSLCEAARVPLQIMELCIEALDVIERFAQIGSKLAISDAGCAAVCVQAALKAAGLNVLINTKSMTDREYAEKLNTHAGRMLCGGTSQADRIFDRVRNELK